MYSNDLRLEALGARIDALVTRAATAPAPSREDHRQLARLREQCAGLREDLVALEALGGLAAPHMSIIIEQALDTLERDSLGTATAPQPADEPPTRTAVRRPRKASTIRRK